MDSRFQASADNELKQLKVVLHPQADIRTVRMGLAVDAFDLTPFVSSGSHTMTQADVTLDWNHELDGANQPAPNQVLEVQANGLPLWIGIIDAISSYRVSFGQRQMTITARSRDSLDIWRTAKRVTNLYPQATNLMWIAADVATAVGLKPDEIALPPSSYVTRHSNTQLADMSAWEMMTTVFLAMGLTPFIDGQGRLRGASRDIQSRASDVVLTEDRVKSVNASRHRAPTSRVILKWLDPNLSQSLQQLQKIQDATITTGFFVPYVAKDIWFSNDRTQRAANTFLYIKHSANALYIPVCVEQYAQDDELHGTITLFTLGYAQAIFVWATIWLMERAHHPDQVTGTITVPPGGGVVPIDPAQVLTIPTGRIAKALVEMALFVLLMTVGTGVYEIWGQPFTWIHARSTTEAYDSSGMQVFANSTAYNLGDQLLDGNGNMQLCTTAGTSQSSSTPTWSTTVGGTTTTGTAVFTCQGLPNWYDNPQEISNDFIADEPMADAVATRELIYQARKANGWEATIVEDRRLEYGDIVEFPDGSRMYLEDCTRQLTFGSENTLTVRGFVA